MRVNSTPAPQGDAPRQAHETLAHKVRHASTALSPGPGQPPVRPFNSPFSISYSFVDLLAASPIGFQS